MSKNARRLPWRGVALVGSAVLLFIEMTLLMVPQSSLPIGRGGVSAEWAEKIESRGGQPSRLSSNPQGCDAVALQAARNTVREWCAASRNHFVHPNCDDNATAYSAEPVQRACDAFSWHGRPMFASVWEERLPCTRVAPGTLPATAADYTVTVVAMDYTLRTVAEVAATWGPRAVALGATVNFVLDRDVELSPSVRAELERIGAVITILAGVDEGDDASGGVASLPLRAIRYAATANPLSAWHVVVTDSTWLSLEEAVVATRFLDPRLPVLIGHIDTGRVRGRQPIYDGTSVFATRPAAAAGVILSAAGAREVAIAVLTPSCPWPSEREPLAQDWGMVLGRCAWTVGMPQLHSTLMWPTSDHVFAKSWHFDRNDAALESLITIAPYEAYTYLRSDGSVNDTLRSVDAALQSKYNASAFFSGGFFA